LTRYPSAAFERRVGGRNTRRPIVTTLGHFSLRRPGRRRLAESSISRGKVAFAGIFLLPFLPLLWFAKATEVAASNFVQAPAGSI
jgi:hypothetical protein